MQNKRPPLPLIIVIVVVAAIGIYYGFRALSGNSNGQLQASGTIEATNVNVAPELAGKVKDVLVSEGQNVQAGDPLLHLDSSLLQAQKQQALAALDVARSAAATADAALSSAQNQYDLALNSALTSERAKRTSQWVNSAPSAFNLPLWYYTQAEQMTAAQAEVDASQEALTDAQGNLASVEASAGSSDFVKIEKDLAAAEAAYRVANDLNNRVQNGKNIDQLTRYELYQLSIQQNNPSGNPANYLISASNIDQNIKNYSQQLFDDAKATLKDTQNTYNNALTTNGAKDVLKARANISLQQERYNTAMDYVSFIRTGSMSPSVTTAQAALNQAEAANDQAHNAVQQAQASVDLIDVQLAKLTIYAPIDGTILTRNVEPGEFVQPGAIALSMANISEMTITVYVPEDRLREISLGQNATVKIDSATGNRPTFSAVVINIADQAEFTPRNVQTVEGRSSTVYAVKLKVSNPTSELKIGMPADVTFTK